MRISEIKQTDIQREVNIMAKTHAPKTVHNAHGLLSSVLKTYRPDFALATKLPPKQPRKPYVPSDDDINRLIQGVKGTELCKAILLAAFGSFRRSEIAAFTSDDIDRDTCIISVNKAMVYSDEKRWVIKNFPKTDAGFRDVTIPLFVVDALPTSGRLVNLLPSSITDGFRKKLKKLGIKHFRFHDLRHYQASILHALGVPDHYIMERGGWKSDYTLKTVYRHTMDEKRKEVERGINEYFTNRFGHDIGHEQ
jgi:integrase